MGSEQEMTVLPDEMSPSAGVWLESIPDFVPGKEVAHWQPILRMLGARIAAEFIWAATTDTIETYEHRLTQRYLHIDGQTDEFLNQRCEAISAEAALEHARRPAAAKVPPPQPEVLVEEFTADPQGIGAPSAVFTPEEVQAVAEAPGTEPALSGFTRTHGLDPTTPFWSALATRVESAQSGWSNRTGLFEDVKQRLLAKASGWSRQGFSNGHENTPGSGSAPDGQQPSFAAFTRRTSAL